ncbi:MAG: hypothetical protein ACRD3W_21785 [Terriglobales bacterium]
MAALGYLLWSEARNVYAVTNKEELAALAERASILRFRVDRSEHALEDAFGLIEGLIEKKGKDIVASKDEDTRKATFDEVSQLTKIEAAIKSQQDLAAYVSQAVRDQEDALRRMGGEPLRVRASLQDLQKLLQNTLAQATIQPSFADTPTPQHEPSEKVPPAAGSAGDSVPPWLRIVAQLVVTGVVSLFLAILGIWSTKFIFSSLPSGASGEQLTTHQESRKFAQDIVKTLLSFSLGIVTGLVAVK